MTESLLLALTDAEIAFVLIGGMAAVAQGVPYVTDDVDIVYRRTPENIDKLIAFLDAHDAIYRAQFGRRIKPKREHLGGTGTALTQTDLGQLDLVGAIRDGRGYDELVPLSIVLDVDGRRIVVLALDVIVAIKRASTDEKDRAQLPLLEATLARLNSRE